MAYLFLNSNQTVTVNNRGVNVLKDIVVMNAGTSWRIQVFDSATGSGALVADLNPPTVGGQFDFGGAELANGFTVVTSGTTPGVATITYE